MFTWVADARSQVSELLEPLCGIRFLAPTQDFPQLGAAVNSVSMASTARSVLLDYSRRSTCEMMLL